MNINDNYLILFCLIIKVRFNLFGNDGETGIRIMDDEKRKIFRRGGVDSFIMSHKKYLFFISHNRVNNI